MAAVVLSIHSGFGEYDHVLLLVMAIIEHA